MARTIALGEQDFGKIIEHDYFYIDKTDFIKEWWEKWGYRHFDHPPQTFWKNTYYENGRAVFFDQICREKRSV